MHATDATNASRTLLYDIHRGDWDDELLRLLGVPRSHAAGGAGQRRRFRRDRAVAVRRRRSPIRGIAGDQQAATVGQACFKPGMVKSTYGTGCFAVLNTGAEAVASQNKLLTTIAYRLDGKTTYALEGSIFIAGAAVQWLRDGLEADRARRPVGAARGGGRSRSRRSSSCRPSPGSARRYWDAEARGALFGLTRATGPRELARAALEAVCFQTHDLIEAMRSDWSAHGSETVLRVDGGMVASDWTMQRLADILAAPVDRPRDPGDDGARRRLARRTAGRRLARRGGVRRPWQRDRRFEPQLGDDERRRKLAEVEGRRQANADAGRADRAECSAAPDRACCS